MIAATIMLIVAGGILIYNDVNENRAEKETSSVVDFLEISMEPYSELNEVGMMEKDLTWLEDGVSLGTKYSKKINGVNYIGILYFPSIDNLSIPVIDECTDGNLKISACRYAGSMNEENMVIAGHNYKSIFGKLSSKFEIGDTTYFKDLEGIVYKYTLKNKEDLGPDDVQKMQEGDWDLTLFTCTYDGRARIAYRFILDN